MSATTENGQVKSTTVESQGGNVVVTFWSESGTVILQRRYSPTSARDLARAISTAAEIASAHRTTPSPQGPRST